MIYVYVLNQNRVKTFVRALLEVLWEDEDKTNDDGHCLRDQPEVN